MATSKKEWVTEDEKMTVDDRRRYRERLLEQIYQHYREKREAPACVREYIYEVLGRIL